MQTRLPRSDIDPLQPDLPSEGQDSIEETGSKLSRYRPRLILSAIIPLAFVTGLAAGYLIWGNKDIPADDLVVTPAQPTQSQETFRLEVSADDDPFLGPEDAPITIIEFSDFNCPFCQRFHQETMGPLMNAYPNQIRFVYRDLPVVGGGTVGLAAAQAAECADDQGAYWEYHDALFSGNYDHGREGYLAIADDLGLDVSDIAACLEAETYADEVKNDARDAARLGITGTPTFLLNGIPLVGAQPLSRFVEIIERELEN